MRVNTVLGVGLGRLWYVRCRWVVTLLVRRLILLTKVWLLVLACSKQVCMCLTGLPNCYRLNLALIWQWAGLLEAARVFTWQAHVLTRSGLLL